MITKLSSQPAQTKNFQNLARDIQAGRCVLMLGPEVAFADQPTNASEAIIRHLNQDLEESFSYSGEDQLFAFNSKRAERDAYYAIENLFDRLQPNALYEKIAAIPFQLILSLSPDLLLPKIFKTNDFPYKFSWYDKTQNPKNFPAIGTGETIIYNLFGNIRERDSLIHTYPALFEYLINISGKHELPPILREYLQKADNFIFLGFDYHKWYLKLLLHVLKLNDDKIISANGEELAEELRINKMKSHIISLLELNEGQKEPDIRWQAKIRDLLLELYELTNKKETLTKENPYTPLNVKTFYEKHFKIHFIEKYDINTFVNQLYESCQDFIRKPNEQPIKLTVAQYEGLNKWIVNNKIEKVFSFVKAFLSEHRSNYKYLDDWKILEMRYNENEEEKMVDLISKNNYKVEKANIIKAILKMLKRLSSSSE